jgi:hypothetical protein
MLPVRSTHGNAWDSEATANFDEPEPRRTYHRPKPEIVTIYFVGPEGGPIKIGHAYQPDKRLRMLELANAYPLRLWAAVKGPPQLETTYHLRFAEHRLHGEWFERCAAIEDEIARLNRPCNRIRVQGLSHSMGKGLAPMTTQQGVS